MSGNDFVYDVIGEYINVIEDNESKIFEIERLIDYLERCKKEIEEEELK